MTKQILFGITLLITVGIFAYTVNRLIGFFRFTKHNFPVRNIGTRIKIMIDVAIGQTKIFRRPMIGFFHALVFWGFCVIVIGSIEMVIDGLSGSEKALKIFGIVYKVIIASGDIFGLLVAISIIVFLARRLFFHIARFEGIEMKPKTHIDAIIALSMIFLLMLSLLGMNAGYCAHQNIADEPIAGVYPISSRLSRIICRHVAGNYFEDLPKLLVEPYYSYFHFCQYPALFKAFSCFHVCTECFSFKA